MRVLCDNERFSAQFALTDKGVVCICSVLDSDPRGYSSKSILFQTKRANQNGIRKCSQA